MGLQENLHSETVRMLALRTPVTAHPDAPVREVVEEMKAGMAPQLYKALMAGT